MPSASTQNPLGGWHYLLVFSAFALLALVVMGPKYQARQTDIEQQYDGIRQVQRREQAERGAPADPRFELRAGSGALSQNPQPLLIALRPLMLVAATAMLGAWGVLQWKRLQQARDKPTRSEQPQS